MTHYTLDGVLVHIIFLRHSSKMGSAVVCLVFWIKPQLFYYRLIQILVPFVRQPRMRQFAAILALRMVEKIFTTEPNSFLIPSIDELSYPAVNWYYSAGLIPVVTIALNGLRR